LLRVPDLTWANLIVPHLTLREVLAISSSSKGWRLAGSSQPVWQALLERDFQRWRVVRARYSRSCFDFLPLQSLQLRTLHENLIFGDKGDPAHYRDIVVVANSLPRHVLPEALASDPAFFRHVGRGFNDCDCASFVKENGSDYAIPPALTFGQAMRLRSCERRSIEDVSVAQPRFQLVSHRLNLTSHTGCDSRLLDPRSGRLRSAGCAHRNRSCASRSRSGRC
jgi:hypothetical protein